MCTGIALELFKSRRSNIKEQKDKQRREVAQIKVAISGIAFNIESIAARSVSKSSTASMTCPEMHFVEWDFFKELLFLVEKDPEFLKQAGWLLRRAREINKAISRLDSPLPSALQNSKTFGRSFGDREINRLQFAEHMSEIHPHHRTGKDRERAYSYPDDRERKARARQAAEALFAPRPAPSAKPVDQLAQRPHVSPTASPPAQHEAIRAPTSPPLPSPKAIPAGDLLRIRTWMKYGMTIAQVAAVYGVDVGETERALRKT